MRWSERLAALFLFFHEIPRTIRSDPLSRQPSLILFSLDADAQSCDVILAAAYRYRLRDIRCGPGNRIRSSAIRIEFGSRRCGSGRVYTCDLWLRVPLSGISAFHRTRVGTQSPSSCHLFYSSGSRHFVFSHGLSAITVASDVTFWRQPRHRSLRARGRSHATGFRLGRASPRRR
ncbi:MAG: hypothetical protein QOH88_2494 [Verrucomicrobiota bacterium]|jgi:hypothetical protein